jgi:hypothetical protein
MLVVSNRAFDMSLSGGSVWGDEGGEDGNGGGAGCICAAHEDGENVDSGAPPNLSNSIG